MDIIVTTPKSQIENAAQEAKDALEGKVDYYFRNFDKLPRNLQKGDHVFYVENGFITGFAVVYGFVETAGKVICQTTGKDWKGCLVYMECNSWKWIKPIPMKGFQGFRYTPSDFEYTVVGDWKDPKPKN